MEELILNNFKLPGMNAYKKHGGGELLLLTSLPNFEGHSGFPQELRSPLHGLSAIARQVLVTSSV